MKRTFKFMFMSRRQTTGQYLYMKEVNESFQNVAKFSVQVFQIDYLEKNSNESKLHSWRN
jgi:hypothetical protein